MNKQSVVGTENRRHSRLNGSFNAIIKTDYLGEKKVVCRNISQSGILLEVSFSKLDQPEVSFICLKYEKIYLRVNFGHEIDNIEAIGIAKWGKEINFPVQRMNKNYAIGIEFINLLPEQKNRLGKYISEQLLLNRVKNELAAKFKNATTVTSVVERRVYSRREVSLPVTYKYNDRFLRGYTKDISSEGMFLVTDLDLELGAQVHLLFSIPEILRPISIIAKVVRANKLRFTQGQCIPHGIGLKFEYITREQKFAIQHFAEHHRFKPRPELKVLYEPRFCHLYTVDLSIGCEYGCLYCHFSRLNQKRYIGYGNFPIPVDITSIYTMENLPEVLYLSPTSEAFAPITKELTHELFSYLLPKGVTFVIVTKGIIPEKTVELIKKYPAQFEGITIGVTNLDLRRNSILEPNAPSAEERLSQIPRLSETGVRIGIRIDPIFPTIDDTNENLNQLVKTAAGFGVGFITATYIFSFGHFLDTLRKVPFLKDSVTYIIEKSPMQGGLAYTAPFEMKLKTYDKLFALCNSFDIEFNTCGCKERRLREVIDKIGYSTICRNKKYYQNHIK